MASKGFFLESGIAEVDVRTDTHGVASVSWTLGYQLTADQGHGYHHTSLRVTATTVDAAPPSTDAYEWGLSCTTGPVTSCTLSCTGAFFSTYTPTPYDCFSDDEEWQNVCTQTVECP